MDPSGLYVTAWAALPGRGNAIVSRPTPARHTLTRPLLSPVAIVEPEGSNATACRLPCCTSVWTPRSLPVATSHTLAVPSAPALATVLPSGLNARSSTLCVCPPNRLGSGSVGPNVTRLPSVPPAARMVPSALMASALTCCAPVVKAPGSCSPSVGSHSSTTPAWVRANRLVPALNAIASNDPWMSRCLPLATSSMLTPVSRSRAITVVPSGLSATSSTAGPGEGWITWAGPPATGCHRRTLPSSAPIASTCPVWSNATPDTAEPIGSSFAGAPGWTRSQRRTVPSSLPLARCEPSGENARSPTLSRWPRSVVWMPLRAKAS